MSLVSGHGRAVAVAAGHPSWSKREIRVQRLGRERARCEVPRGAGKPQGSTRSRCGGTDPLERFGKSQILSGARVPEGWRTRAPSGAHRCAALHQGLHSATISAAGQRGAANQDPDLQSDPESDRKTGAVHRGETVSDRGRETIPRGGTEEDRGARSETVSGSGDRVQAHHAERENAPQLAFLGYRR
uniref:Uncharacterized protein n=1 Tax=Anopheles albimanus TaxID=7167 RepID=A0A182F7J4_ANOAL